VAIFILYPIEH